MNFHETERAVRTASSEQVRQPIYSGSVQTWKRYGEHLDGLERFWSLFSLSCRHLKHDAPVTQTGCDLGSERI